MINGGGYHMLMEVCIRINVMSDTSWVVRNLGKCGINVNVPYCEEMIEYLICFIYEE